MYRRGVIARIAMQEMLPEGGVRPLDDQATVGELVGVLAQVGGGGEEGGH